MTAPLRSYSTPVLNPSELAEPTVLDLGAYFPTVIPAVEEAIYQRVHDACSSRLIFPTDGSGIQLPAAFNIPPDVSLYRDKDGTYTIPVGSDQGQPIPPIPVVRGWPAYPGAVPSIGVAEATAEDDHGEETIQGGFAGDAIAYDDDGNALGTCAYYAEPIQTVVVVELIHENRDERDRLHDQLRRLLFPLKHLLPKQTAQIRSVHVGAEKQDLPQGELPRVMYVSVYTITVGAEALIPTEIVPNGVITEITAVPEFYQATDPTVTQPQPA